MRDYYDILGVNRGCDEAGLKAAFRKLAMEHHPDRNGGSPESTARAQEIQLAFEELRARPVPEGTLEERLAKLEAELAERKPAERGPDPSVVRVTSLIDGLDDLASRIDRF